MIMWSAVISGITSIVSNWFETKKAKQQAEIEFHKYQAKAESDWDLVAQQQARYSWKDEFITLVWFAPLIYAWFDSEKAMGWITFVEKLPYWYQFGMFGIISASFGLRWYFKQQGFKVGKHGKGE